MRQQAKTTIYRLAPVVMLAITVAAPSKWVCDEEFYANISACRGRDRDIRCLDRFGRCTLEMVLS